MPFQPPPPSSSPAPDPAAGDRQAAATQAQDAAPADQHAGGGNVAATLQPSPHLAALRGILTPASRAQALPALPTHLAAGLSQRELMLAQAMTAGLSYRQASELVPATKRSRPDPAECPPRVQAAADYFTQEVARACGLSREWIVMNLVAIYQRAAQSVQVLDRKGKPTGEYRFDGQTALKALEMLGKEAGMFGQRVTHDVSQDVRELMRLVASRGRPALEAPRLVGQHDAAPQSSDRARKHESTIAKAHDPAVK